MELLIFFSSHSFGRGSSINSNNTKTNPWLSVIIPTYNGQAYLAQTLASIEEQQEKDLELIAVDDGSDDQTCEILAEYSQRLPLRIIKQPHCGNWVTNTNLGLQAARGSYISLLHQDDYWLKDRLSTLRRLSEKHPDAVLFLHPSWFVDEQSRPLGKWQCPFPKDLRPLPFEATFPCLLVQNFISIPAPMFQREAVLRTGLMDESLWFTADWKLWLNLSQEGSWIYHPQPLSCFRIHAQSQTVQGCSGHSEQYARVLDEFLHLSPEPKRSKQLAHYSLLWNSSLSGYLQQQPLGLGNLIIKGLMLGPKGLYLFWKYSRLYERTVSRLRVRSITNLRQTTAENDK